MKFYIDSASYNLNNIHNSPYKDLVQYEDCIIGRSCATYHFDNIDNNDLRESLKEAVEVYTKILNRFPQEDMEWTYWKVKSKRAYVEFDTIAQLWDWMKNIKHNIVIEWDFKDKAEKYVPRFGWDLINHPVIIIYDGYLE